MKIHIISDKDVTLGITGFLARIKGILGLYIFNGDAVITYKCYSRLYIPAYNK